MWGDSGLAVRALDSRAWGLVGEGACDPIQARTALKECILFFPRFEPGRMNVLVCSSRLGGFNNRHLFSHSWRGSEIQDKVLANSVPGENSLASFFLCPHMGERERDRDIGERRGTKAISKDN